MNETNEPAPALLPGSPVTVRPAWGGWPWGTIEAVYIGPAPFERLAFVDDGSGLPYRVVFDFQLEARK